MTGNKPQRGPLLSSVVMVMLATAATGLLALIGLQALPDSVVPSTFGGDDHEARSVDISESPEPVTTTKPAVKPSATSTSAAPAPERTTATKAPNPVRTATTVATSDPTSGPTRTATKTTAPPRKTTSPSPTATKTPSPTTTTQAPSPAPSCGTARKPRCPKAVETSPPAYSAPGSYSYSSYGGGDAPSYSSTQSKQDKPAKKGKPAKRYGKTSKR